MKVVVLLLLVASLAGNAALLIHSRPTGGESAKVGPASNDPLSSTRASAAESTADGSSKVNAAFSGESVWDALPVGDLEALAAALREQGYPPHLVRGIVSHHLNLEYEARRKELREGDGITPYWKQSVLAPSGNAGRRAELRALNREMAVRLGELTGTETTLYTNGGPLHAMRQQYGDLPVATLEAIIAIEQDYGDLTREVREAGQGLMFPSDREKIALLEQEKKKDLLSILSPAEYEELQLRSSATAQRLRTNLVVMEPTEQEFRTIHNLQKEFDDRYSSTTGMRNDPAFRNEQRAAEQALLAAVKAELGPERGAAYELSRDSNYVHAHTVARQLSLPADAGDRLYALQKDAFQQFNAVGAGSGANAEQRQAAQRTFIQEKTAAIVAIVGENNLSTYRNGMGSWLNILDQMASRGSTSGTTTTRIVAPPTISVTAP